MQVSLQQQADFLTLAIPKTIANQMGLQFNSIVEVILVNGNLLVKPVVKPKFTLEQLLSGVTTDNLHGEVDTGQSTGNEVY
ncbi:MAG: hypothetical protein B6242_12800 [Anaerolineaceae bacterium 4572_78]|nr:MAG: hypothetical protein B6242_12800 [Anaerolineaceae bacterium 4572_78]